MCSFHKICSGGNVKIMCKQRAANMQDMCSFAYVFAMFAAPPAPMMEPTMVGGWPKPIVVESIMGFGGSGKHPKSIRK